MPSKIEQLLSAATVRLRDALEAAGWAAEDPVVVEVEGARASRGATAISFERAGARFEAVLQGVVGSASFDTLRRALADGLLTGRAATRGTDRRPMAIVVATPLSEAMVGRLHDYARWVDPDAAWGVVDPRGIVRLHGPRRGADADAPLVSDVVASARRRPPASAEPGPRAKLFTDLRQWMLKVLLAPRISEDLLAADRGPVRSSAELAERARVSESMVSRFLADLEGHGFLNRAGPSLQLVRVGDLLDAWRGDTAGAARDLRVRFDLPSSDPARQVRRMLERERPWIERAPDRDSPAPRPRLCLGLFEACRNLGLGQVSGAPVHLYHEDPDSPLHGGLEHLGLQRVEDRSEHDVFLRRPTAPESVFRGAVVRDGVLTADVLQCWLDLADHPVRGREQADELLARTGLLDGETE